MLSQFWRMGDSDEGVSRVEFSGEPASCLVDGVFYVHTRGERPRGLGSLYKGTNPRMGTPPL